MSVVRLPRCPNCGAFHYPPREVCPACFVVPEGPMPVVTVSGAGTVAASTRLHVSLSPLFAPELPVLVASVALAVGPVVLCFAEDAIAPGDSVTVRQKGEPPVFVASSVST